MHKATWSLAAFASFTLPLATKPSPRAQFPKLDSIKGAVILGGQR